MDTWSEQYRHECEARYWLLVIGLRPQDIDDLIERIQKRRGRWAAQRLKDEMRRQYKLGAPTKTIG